MTCALARGPWAAARPGQRGGRAAAGAHRLRIPRHRRQLLTLCRSEHKMVKDGEKQVEMRHFLTGGNPYLLSFVEGARQESCI